MRSVQTLFAAAVLLGAASIALSQTGAVLRAGYAKTDITPSEPVKMAGYDMRGAPSDGVHPGEKLYLRALVLDDGRTRVAFIEADVISMKGHDTWRKKVAEATGIPFGNILLGDAHNHSAPSPNPETKTNWVRQFGEALPVTVKQAISRLEPVKIAAGSGRSRIAMNRRVVRAAAYDSTLTFDENARSQSFGKYKVDKPVTIHEPAGVMRLGANPAGSIDDEVQVVRLDTASGKPLAVMVHYACHGTSLGGRNSKIAGEWMGRMQKYLEDQFPGTGAMFIQGAAGDINPRVVGGLDGAPDDIHVTWALGEEIGREAARVYRTLTPETVAASIRIETKDMQLPRTYRELFDNFEKTTVKVPVTAVRIGDLMWVTFPGELFHAIGQRLKAACPATHAHFMGYTNGYVGYLPEQKAFAEGGYEPSVSHFDPIAEHVFMREVSDLLKRFR